MHEVNINRILSRIAYVRGNVDANLTHKILHLQGVGIYVTMISTVYNIFMSKGRYVGVAVKLLTKTSLCAHDQRNEVPCGNNCWQKCTLNTKGTN